MRLSETALDVLVQAVRQSRLANGRCLRLLRADGGYALTIDTPTGWDKVIERDSVSFMAVAKDVEESLGDAFVDVKEDDGAFQLIIRKQAAGGGEQREVA